MKSFGSEDRSAHFSDKSHHSCWQIDQSKRQYPSHNKFGPDQQLSIFLTELSDLPGLVLQKKLQDISELDLFFSSLQPPLIVQLLPCSVTARPIEPVARADEDLSKFLTATIYRDPSILWRANI